jgi:hypothetical protein
MAMQLASPEDFMHYKLTLEGRPSMSLVSVFDGPRITDPDIPPDTTTVLLIMDPPTPMTKLPKRRHRHSYA